MTTISKSLLSLFMLLLPVVGTAQKVKYETFIYTSETLAGDIAKESSRIEAERADGGAGHRNQFSDKHSQQTLGGNDGGTGHRNLFTDMFKVGASAGKSITSGCVTKFFDLGENAIGSLLTRNTRLKDGWLQTIKKENTYQDTIKTVSEINDFYAETSFDGAMDPKGMLFDGIGCLRKENGDTVFYVSCHIDRSKLYRIINHSKFELVLDTLILSPMHSNLPNTMLKTPFSFEEREHFNLSMDIKITSSWMNHIVQLQKDQLLGEFSINIPVEEKALDEKGFLRYVRKDGEPSAYTVAGESFIVPRSFMGYRGADGEYKNSWGTGEYELNIVLKETTSVHYKKLRVSSVSF